MSRTYDSSWRRQQAEGTSERVLDAAERLFSREPYDRVTLSGVAKAAGVAVPTVQRKFGDKEGLFAAWGERWSRRVASQRGLVPVQDVPAALAQLVGHYETEGALVWHLLRQEADVPALRAGLPQARAVHRAWVQGAFGHLLRGLRGRAREARVDALVAATDLFTWKLLRLDLGRSKEQVESTLMAMVQAIAGAR